MENILSIELVFENTDYITIPYTDIIFIKISKVSETYQTSSAHLSFQGLQVTKYLQADSLELKLGLATLQKFKTFLGENAASRILKYNDITHIRLNYTNDSIQDITLAWEAGKFGTNKLQKVDIIEDQLVININ